MPDTCSHLDDVDRRRHSVGARAARTACASAVAGSTCGCAATAATSAAATPRPTSTRRAHFASVGHPLVSSYEPGEDWWWCYVDELGFLVADLPTYSHP